MFDIQILNEKLIVELTNSIIGFGHFYYPLAQQSCGGDIGSVPYVCM